MAELLFFGVPIAAVLFFGVSLWRFLSAKGANKKAPGTYTENQLAALRLVLILASVIAGVICAIVVGFICLMFMAVAYM